MFTSILSSSKLRLASVGVASTLLTSIVFPNTIVLAATASQESNTNATPTSANVGADTIGKALANDGVLADSNQVAASSADTTAIKAAVGGAEVSVPKVATSGITVNGINGQALNIQLPSASEDADATTVANGTVAYAGHNGSANAVQTDNDGSIKMLTVIDSPTAPTIYAYKITVPDGGRIQLTNDGGAVVLDSNGKVLASVAVPWAHDANGKQIRTYFTTDGQTLIQHILHNVPGVVYPVTADPHFSWGWSGLTVYLNRTETNYLAWGAGAFQAYFGWTGLPAVAAYALISAAQWATSHGYCVAFTEGWWSLTHNGIPYIWIYRC